MNKRITTLHNQAILHSHSNGGLRISSHIPSDYIEKLAELIIQECAQVMEECEEDIPNISKVVYNVKEHFGVK